MNIPTFDTQSKKAGTNSIYRPTGNESSRFAFYRPVTAGLPLRKCMEDEEEDNIELEKRALSIDEEDNTVPEKRAISPDECDTKPDDFDKRKSFESSLYSSSTASSAKHVFDFHQLDEEVEDDDDDDAYSVNTYNTVDTSATSESVQSIISRLQSETDRRRRRIMRRRCARTGKRPSSMKPAKPEDQIRGITVQIRE